MVAQGAARRMPAGGSGGGGLAGWVVPMSIVVVDWRCCLCDVSSSGVGLRAAMPGACDLDGPRSGRWVPMAAAGGGREVAMMMARARGRGNWLAELVVRWRGG